MMVSGRVQGKYMCQHTIASRRLERAVVGAETHWCEELDVFGADFWDYRRKLSALDQIRVHLPAGLRCIFTISRWFPVRKRA